MAVLAVLDILSNAKKTEKLAYILGSFFEDGFFPKDNGRVIFSSSDIDFIKLRSLGLEAQRIKRYLNVNVPKPAIESWIYRKS